MATMNRPENMTHTNKKNNKKDPQKKHRLGTVSKNTFTEGLKLVHSANLTLSSDADQDTYIDV